MFCDDLDSDVADLAGADTCLYCCLPLAQCECLAMHETEPDYGGAFDGFTVTSDADPGL